MPYVVVDTKVLNVVEKLTKVVGVAAAGGLAADKDNTFRFVVSCRRNGTLVDHGHIEKNNSQN